MLRNLNMHIENYLCNWSFDHNMQNKKRAPISYNKMYAISEKNVIKWSIAQIIFNVHIKITKHCDDKIKE
jgi:hypothetical protein